MADAFNDMTTSLSHWHERGAAARRAAAGLVRALLRRHAVGARRHRLDRRNGRDHLLAPARGSALRLLRGGARSAACSSTLLAPGCQERYATAVPEISREADGAPARADVRRRRHPRGRHAFPLELSLASWKSGGQTCFTAVIRDVTERRRAEEALRQRDQQLREAQKMDAIGRLASGIAHDFNNSLMVIQGHAEMLLARTCPDDPTRGARRSTSSSRRRPARPRSRAGC